MWVGKGRKGEGEREQMEERGRGLAGLQNCSRLLVSLKLKMGDVCIKKSFNKCYKLAFW